MTTHLRRRDCSRWHVSVVSLLLILCLGTTTTTTSAVTLDLSYLFRTKSSSMAAAIKHCYFQRIQLNGEETTIHLDLTSSLMEKNFTEVLEAALSPATKFTKPIFLRLTAKRNQWTSKEGTEILQYLLGLCNETESIDKNDDEKAGHQEAPASSNTTAIKEQQSVGGSDASGDATSILDGISAVTIGQIESVENVTADTGKKPVEGRAPKPAFLLQTLDLGWNYLGGGSSRTVKTFHKALQQLVCHHCCPSTLNLELCGLSPATCRAIAKGIVERSLTENVETGQLAKPTSLCLNLACNEAIGDGGVAALAAAVRTVSSHKRRRKRKDQGEVDDSSQSHEDDTIGEDDDPTVLETLDLSACSISDAGAEALAVALKRHPLCVKHLDLSNNFITDEGAASLARALLEKNSDNIPGKLTTLNLSNNKGIGDRGAKELSRAFQEGCVESMILRSCHLHADGAGYFGKAIRNLANQNGEERIRRLAIDLSGNPLGILRKKSKPGNKYSASALKTKATETTTAYMNFIGKTVQKGLKDLGLGEGSNGIDTLESDDEEEERMGKADEEDNDSKNKCGGIALAEAFITEGDQEMEDSQMKNNPANADKSLHIQLGLRHCCLDTRAAEALAAVLQESRRSCLSFNLTFDMRMNEVLEEDIVSALHGEAGFDDKISEMAENYLDAVEVIRETQERALVAARIARARAKAAAAIDDAWGSPVGLHAVDDGLEDYDKEWDSDADYDPPGGDEDDYWS
ncbi:leucine rich repeat LRR-containing protein [Nitzschia inconspicua]|uniref:Leucine rich repeat LRR-containing protein n=1 Tax=Nitzschia inconspicua TaxID=303405 RepID=A0A9K3KSL0_9STRA|nr:leucine rich repeat LRR-containing protein [Nitzschia inconspicua]